MSQKVTRTVVVKLDLNVGLLLEVSCDEQDTNGEIIRATRESLEKAGIATQVTAALDEVRSQVRS